VREHNEDSLQWFEPDDAQLLQRKGRLYVVADGMGGHAAGEVASGLAVETLVEEFQNEEGTDIPAYLERAIRAANTAIYQQARGSERAGMGTTIVCAVVRGNELYLGHVGDSRAYLLRGGELRQLTQDHSLISSQVRNGACSAEEAMDHPQRHILTRAVGVRPQVQPDIQGPLALLAGDVLLLCTDGICGYLSDEQIARILLEDVDEPEISARELIKAANATGGQDNSTALVVYVEEVAPLTMARRRPITAPAFSPPIPFKTTLEELGDPTLPEERRDYGPVRKPWLARRVGETARASLLIAGLLISMAIGAVTAGTIGLPFFMSLRGRSLPPAEATVVALAARGQPLPTPTPSPSQTVSASTRTPAPTPTPFFLVVTATPQPTRSPTVTLPPSVTPTVSTTTTVWFTPIMHESMILVEPANGTDFVGEAAEIRLSWVGRPLAADEWYVIRYCVERAADLRQVVWQWTRDAMVLAPSTLYNNLNGERRVWWSVSIVRLPAGGIAENEPLDPATHILFVSEERWFYWKQ